MIGHDKPGLARGPAMIAAALLGSVAIGGLGWSLGRASAERAPAVAQATERGIPATTAAVPKSRDGTRTPLVKVPPRLPADRHPPESVDTEAISTPATEDAGQARAVVAKPEAPAVKPEGVKPAPVKPARINLNTATAAELELLPGIGPGLAQRIIEHREKAGRFRTVAELDKVKGIGPRTIDKLRPLVSVE
ncbi:MAG: helix-hairpin-helix domain-containing protein [Phycisphaerales bacterium]|nr:helix-hairpin-helix domain-containing protein [Phycisphaerales bacterium]